MPRLCPLEQRLFLLKEAISIFIERVREREKETGWEQVDCATCVCASDTGGQSFNASLRPARCSVALLSQASAILTILEYDVKCITTESWVMISFLHLHHLNSCLPESFDTCFPTFAQVQKRPSSFHHDIPCPSVTLFFFSSHGYLLKTPAWAVISESGPESIFIQVAHETICHFSTCWAPSTNSVHVWCTLKFLFLPSCVLQFIHLVSVSVC